MNSGNENDMIYKVKLLGCAVLHVLQRSNRHLVLLIQWTNLISNVPFLQNIPPGSLKKFFSVRGTLLASKSKRNRELQACCCHNPINMSVLLLRWSEQSVTVCWRTGWCTKVSWLAEAQSKEKKENSGSSLRKTTRKFGEVFMSYESC